MARSRFSARDLAPVLIPLVTRVAVPMAMRSFRKGSNDLNDAFEGVRDRMDKNVKRTRSDFDDVRDEAVVRGRKLVDEAVKHGTELLDMLSSKGVGAAEDWAKSISKPKRGFPWGKLLAVAAIAGVGVMIYNRD